MARIKFEKGLHSIIRCAREPKLTKYNLVTRMAVADGPQIDGWVELVQFQDVNGDGRSSKTSVPSAMTDDKQCSISLFGVN